MGKYYTFHKTVKGYLHEKKGIPCEDNSESYSAHNVEESGQFYIAVVADGHGDTACMRSKLGSQKAAEIAKQCLIEFAEGVISDEQNSGTEQDSDRYKGYRSIHEILANAAVYGKEARDTLKSRVPESLTNAIVSRWHAFVNEDIRQNPLSEEEIAMAERYADAYREGRRLAHVYGTTLIAALMLPDYLLLIQQGDGRCDVFYEDGTVDQPIPWDERCHENVTTSMCDEDAPTSIRSRVINLKERKVIACYLGSDGVEDAYRDMEGTHMFYRNLSCELAERGTDAFEAYLEEMLPGFSQIGSGDDVSVSGIVDMDRIKSFAPSFKVQNDQYNLKEELNRYENRIVSMSRKHGILQERMEEAEKECGQIRSRIKAGCSECNEAEEAYKRAVDKAIKWNQQLTKWEAELEELKNRRRKNMDLDLIPITPKWSKSGFSTPQVNHDICKKQIKERESAIKKYRPEYDKICDAEAKWYDKVCEQKNKVVSLEHSLKKANKQLQAAQQEFDEYDQEYRSIQAEIDRIHKEIDRMNQEKEHINQSIGERIADKPLKGGISLEKEIHITQERISDLHKENHAEAECSGAEVTHCEQVLSVETDNQEHAAGGFQEITHIEDENSEDTPAGSFDAQENIIEIPLESASGAQENMNGNIPAGSSSAQENMREEVPENASNAQENTSQYDPINVSTEERLNAQEEAAEGIQEEVSTQEEMKEQVSIDQKEEEGADKQDYKQQAEPAELDDIKKEDVTGQLFDLLQET